MTYVIVQYWGFAAVALVAGVLIGWWAQAAARRREANASTEAGSERP